MSIGGGVSLVHEAVGEGNAPVVFVPVRSCRAACSNAEMAHFETSPCYRAPRSTRAGRAGPPDARSARPSNSTARTSSGSFIISDSRHRAGLLRRPVSSRGAVRPSIWKRQSPRPRSRGRRAACVHDGLGEGVGLRRRAEGGHQRDVDHASDLAALDGDVPLLFVVREDLNGLVNDSGGHAHAACRGRGDGPAPHALGAARRVQRAARSVSCHNPGRGEAVLSRQRLRGMSWGLP